MDLWLEHGLNIFSAVLYRFANEWQFLGVGVLFWVIGVWIVTILLRNFIYDV